MGNSASQLPYSIDNQVGTPQDHSGWALHNGKSTDGNATPVTVFVGKKPLLAKHPMAPRFPTKMALLPALHHYNQCRKLRHPHILKVLATLDTDNPTAAAESGPGSSSASSSSSAAALEASNKAASGDLIIVTEPCIPLDQWLNSNPSHEQLAWGLECIIQGLHFLHASASLSHGNLHPGSLYVTPSGDVKLWNFCLMTQVGPNLGPSNHFIEWEQSSTPESYRSPERVQLNYTGISNGGGVHAIDSYSLGVLIDYWFKGQIPAVLIKAVQRLQTPNIKMRPRLQPLLQCPVFNTPLQKLQKQFEEITIQPIEHKVELWGNLGLSMQAELIPQDLATYKVLPLIQAGIQTTCSNETLISQDLYRREVLAMINPLFFIVEKYLDPAAVPKTLGPLVSLLFMVKDRGVRGALLNKVKFLSQHLDKGTLNSQVFEPLCSGFNDSSPALRELTLKATMGLVPYLNAPNIEKLSRYLVRLQADTETTIRTNAVIFIAKIAPSLSEIPREKMLLPAYARAMKDTFTPCRLAAIQSLGKSEELFSRVDVACKVLPALTPLLMDPITDVRNAAFQVLASLVRNLQVESDRLAHLAQRQAELQASQQQQQATSSSTTTGMPPTAIAAPAASKPTTTTATTNKTAPAAAAAPSSGGYLSGFSSWMSSSAQPDTPSQSTPAAAPTKPSLSTSPMPAATAPSVPTPSMVATNTTRLAATSLSAPAPVAADDSWGDDDDGDGWGDDDDDGMVEEDPFAKIGTKTTTPAPTRIASPKPVSSGFGDDDDPFAAIGMKTSALGNNAKPAKGKLVLPKSGAIKLSAKPVAPPATKVKLDTSEMGDGWDDF